MSQMRNAAMGQMLLGIMLLFAPIRAMAQCAT